MNEQNDQSNVPNQFICPIFQQVMKDPVLTVDGFCFQRRAIQQWFSKGRNTNPLTNKFLGSTALVQNRVLRQVIQHHNTRIRQIQKQANQNAKSVIKQSNYTIYEVFPQLIDQRGMVSLEKLIAVSSQINQYRSKLRTSVQKFSQLRRLSQKQPVSNSCRQCRSTTDSLRQYKSFLDKQVTQALQIMPIINQKQIKKQKLSYLIMNNEYVKGIDFRRIKVNELIKYTIQGVFLHRLNVEEVVAQIRAERRIPEKDFIRVWITDISTDALYKHIVDQVESITGTYVCKVKCVGKRIQVLKRRINQLEMYQNQFWIIQHGPNEQYVFRNDQTKCDYCYKIRKVQSQCECKKVYYCSKQCQARDKVYHERVCKLIPGNVGQNFLNR